MAQTNDWIVATLNNPNFNPADMQDILGLNVNNTQILSRDKYLESSYIKNHEAFKNDDGSFSNQKFNDFYNYALSTWDQFTSDEKIDSFQYSLFDTRAKSNSLIRDPHFRFETIPNPDRVNIGISGINTTGDRKYTPSELAQMQPIYDSKSGKYLDETPNDRALFNHPLQWVKNLFQDPLVLATYDQDTEEFDPFTGKTIKHKKGEYKLNQDGTYYAETLNGRSTSGKQIIANTDLITLDDSSINKYDFFDSDSLDKSVGGTIMKTASTILPLLLGPHVRAIYSGLLIGRELVKSLPMLYGMATSLFGNESDSEILNTFAGYGEKSTGGISEYGSQHTFSFEQFGRLIGDVATQWGQQQLIARSISELRGSNKLLKRAYDNAAIEYKNQLNKALNAAKSGQLAEAETIRILQMAKGAKDWTKTPFGIEAINKYLPAAQSIVKRNARLGADAALAYMAIVSNYDIYNNMLERGATHKDAALVSLGSTIGMFSVDKFLHLGEMFFNDLEDQAQKALRTYTLENASKYSEILNSTVGKTTQKIEGNFFKRIGQNARTRNVDEVRKLSKAINLGRSIAEEFSNSVKGFQQGAVNHTLGFAGKALGEGLEEVSEEFVSDISKQLYEWASQLGYNTSIEDAGAWDNWFERYAMSLFGGMAGGGMFYGITKFNEAKDKQKNPEAYNAEDEIIYLIRQGKKNDLIRELNKLHDKGKLGSTKFGIESELNENGNRVFLSAKPGQKTQNDIVFNLINQQINILESYINNYGTNLSDDELFKQMVLGDERLLELKSYLNGASYASGYQNEFQEILKNVIDTQILIDNSNNSLTDLQKRRSEANKEESDKIDKNIKESSEIKTTAEKNLIKYKQELNDFLSGKKSLDYARKTVFLADPNLQSIWSFITFEQWLKKKYDKNIDKLSLSEKNEYQTEYLKDLKSKHDFRSDEIWSSFLSLEKTFTPFLNNLEENGNEILKIKEEFNKIFETLKNIQEELNKDLLNIDSKLPNETPEEYENRYKVDDNLSEEEAQKQLNNRIEERQKLIDEYNKNVQESIDYTTKQSQKILEILNSTSTIDPYTYRAIRRLYGDFLKDGGLYINIGLQALEENDEKFTKEYLDFFKKVTSFEIDNLINIANSKLENNIILTSEQIESLTIDIFKHPEQIDEYILKALEAQDLQPDYDRYVDENSDDIKSDDELISLLAEYKTKLSNPKLEVIDNINGLEKLKETINSKINFNDFAITISDAIEGKFIFIEDTNGTPNQLVLSDIGKNKLQNILQEFLLFKDKLQNNPFDEKTYGKISPEQILNAYDELKNYPKLTFADPELQGSLNKLIDLYKSTMQTSINDNPINNILQQIEQKLQDVNPIKNILSVIGQNNIDMIDLDQLLTKIENKIYDLNTNDDFQLTSYEENQLRFFIQMLDVANGFIYQSSTTPNWLSPFGHAKFWNDFTSKNSEIINQEFHIPELDQDIAVYYSTEIQKYKGEIENLLKLHETNAINKKLQEIKASQKLEEVKLDFYKKHSKECFMINKEIRGIRLNLLDKDIPDDATSSEVETQLANGLMRILNQGVTLTEFLNETQILEKLCTNGDLSELTYREPAILDSKLNELSSYQKVQFLLSALLYNKSKFDKDTKSNLNEEKKKQDGSKIAPLTSQQFLIQSIKGFINESGAINEIYDYITSKPKSHYPSYILTQCIIVSGVGGAGKTNAVIKQAVKDLTGDQIWLVGPKLEQAQNLKNAVEKNSRLFDKDSLLNEIFGNENKQINLNDKTKFNQIGQGDDTTYVITNGFKVNTPPNNLKVVVIDEYTYFSKYELQAINLWAKSKNIKIILSGDKNQLGHPDTINDFEMFCLFDLPKLTVSLREQNIHVQNNNITLNNLLTTYSDYVNKYNRGGNYPPEDKEKELLSIIFEQLKNSKLSYYLDNNKFNGTLINPEANDQLITVLKKVNSEKIAVIGNTDRIKKLVNDLNIQHKFDSIEQIQGREFDYVIFDGIIEDEKEHNKYYGQSLLHRLQAIYTLNTRGKEGVVIFDDTFSKIFPELSNVKEFNTISAKTLKDIVNEFIAFEEERLNKLELNGEYHDLSEYGKPIIPKTPEEKEKKEIVDKIKSQEKQLKEQNTPEEIETQLQNLDKEHKEDESKLEKSTLGDQAENSQIANQTIRGYFMPITGTSYTRVKNEDGSIVYKLNEHTNTELNVVAKSLKFNGDLSEDQISQCVTELNKLVRSLITSLTIGNSENIANTKEVWLNYCNIIKDLNEGKAYITLEASDYNEGFKYVGLGTASSKQKDVEVFNNKVYRYVLHFNVKGEEASITLAFAANPETWEEKKTNLENEINQLSNNDPILNDKNQELERLTNEIKNYKKILSRISEEGSYKVEFKEAFTTLRPYYETIQHDNGKTETVIRKRRVDTLVVQKKDGSLIVDSGWRRREGQYKSKSGIFILGNDVDQLGIKASQSGKCCMFVSELDIPENQLLDTYLQEKQNGENTCFVRMIILDNAGINFTTLLNKEYSELYKTQALTKDGKSRQFSLPFKSEVTGHRMLVSMWNWRADLIQFLNLYNKYFNDVNKEDIDKVVQLKYENNQIPEELKSLSDRIDNFNSKICADAKLHTFRLGGTEQHVQQIVGFNDISSYFSNTETIPNDVKEHGIFGLYLNYDTALRYKSYIDAIFSTFNGHGAAVNEITTYNDRGEEKLVKAEENIDGYRLHSLSSKKTSSYQRAPGNSLTNFLDENINCNTITVNDGNTEISFNRVGGSSFLSQFPALFTHMCKILWVINRHSDDPDLNLDLGKIKFKSEDGNEVEFDMSSIKKLIQQNAIPTSSEHFGGDIYVKPFEFMDMLNYMFHGTLEDVSTHSLEWKNGKIVGGRDSWFKITGVMYPKGIFIDPRIDQGTTAYKSEINSSDNKNYVSIHNTNVNPMFLLTGVTSELVMNFDIRFDENNTQNKSIERTKSGENIIITSNEDITIDEILNQFDDIKKVGELYYINGDSYTLSQNNSVNSYTFIKTKESNGLIAKKLDVSQDLMDIENYNEFTDLGGITIGEFVKEKLKLQDDVKLSINLSSDRSTRVLKVLEICDNTTEDDLATLKIYNENDRIELSLLDSKENVLYNSSLSNTSSTSSSDLNEKFDLENVEVLVSNYNIKELINYLNKFKTSLMEEHGFTEGDFEAYDWSFSDNAKEYLNINC